MGTENIDTNYTTGDIVEADHSKQYGDAIDGPLVGRVNGTPMPGQSLGTSTIPWGDLHATRVFIGGAQLVPGLSTVETDASITGDGTSGNPLSVARPLPDPASGTDGQVLKIDSGAWAIGDDEMGTAGTGGTPEWAANSDFTGENYLFHLGTLFYVQNPGMSSASIAEDIDGGLGLLTMSPYLVPNRASAEARIRRRGMEYVLEDENIKVFDNGTRLIDIGDADDDYSITVMDMSPIGTREITSSPQVIQSRNLTSDTDSTDPNVFMLATDSVSSAGRIAGGISYGNDSIGENVGRFQMTEGSTQIQAVLTRTLQSPALVYLYKANGSTFTNGNAPQEIVLTKGSDSVTLTFNNLSSGSNTINGSSAQSISATYTPTSTPTGFFTLGGTVSVSSTGGSFTLTGEQTFGDFPGEEGDGWLDNSGPAFFVHDGFNWIKTGVANLLELADTPSAFGAPGQVLATNPDGDAAEWVGITELPDPSGGTDGQVLKIDSGAWAIGDDEGGGNPVLKMTGAAFGSSNIVGFNHSGSVGFLTSPDAPPGGSIDGDTEDRIEEILFQDSAHTGQPILFSLVPRVNNGEWIGQFDAIVINGVRYLARANTLNGNHYLELVNSEGDRLRGPTASAGDEVIITLEGPGVFYPERRTGEARDTEIEELSTGTLTAGTPGTFREVTGLTWPEGDSDSKQKILIKVPTYTAEYFTMRLGDIYNATAATAGSTPAATNRIFLSGGVATASGVPRLELGRTASRGVLFRWSYGDNTELAHGSGTTVTISKEVTT